MVEKKPWKKIEKRITRRILHFAYYENELGRNSLVVEPISTKFTQNLDSIGLYLHTKFYINRCMGCGVICENIDIFAPIPIPPLFWVTYFKWLYFSHLSTNSNQICTECSSDIWLSITIIFIWIALSVSGLKTIKLKIHSNTILLKLRFKSKKNNAKKITFCLFWKLFSL